MKKGKIFVVSGPSGAGKGTLIKALLEKVDGINYSVSVTTRKPRAGEVDGKDYFFVSEEEFERMVKNGELIEWAYVHNNWYGTPKNWLNKMLKDGKDVLLELDVQGAIKVKKLFPDSVLIFVEPPSPQALIERLKKRSTETEQEMKVRLKTAEKEFEMEKIYDYSIVNDDIESSLKKLIEIVKAERGSCP